jgi:cell wall-associated NlpC family hydrolase
VTTTGEPEQFARRALEWAASHLGDTSYALRCLAFVEDAYERPNGIEVFGGASAAESAERYGTQAYDPLAPPPPGALVFYACAGPIDGTQASWGHVGLALGDGRVIHAWDRVRVDDALAVCDLAPRAGWSQPALLGWTPPSVVLHGHRPRDWAVARDG